MPTTPADLLAEIYAAAGPDAPASVSDADRAAAAGVVGALGAVVARLDRDRIWTGIAALEGPVHQLAELADACRTLGQAAPVSSRRVVELAGIFADAAGASSARATREQRRSLLVATVEAIDRFASVITVSARAGSGSRDPAERVREAARAIRHKAAMSPPTRAANAVLETPVPDLVAPAPIGRNASAGAAIQAAMAAVLADIRPGVQPPTVAEVMAICLAAESLCRAVEERASVPRPGTAGDAWAGIRAALSPFHDGSRRPRQIAPPHIEAARSIYQMTTRHRFGHPCATGIIDAVQHLPQLAAQLRAAVQDWPKRSHIIAHAYRLPPREDRVTAMLAKTQPAGIVRADEQDFVPVVIAVSNAHALSLELAVHVSLHSPPSTRRLLAAHERWLDRPHAGVELVRASRQAARTRQPSRPQPQPPAGRSL